MRLWIALRHSAGSLLRTPGLAGTLITTIAIGIGSNAAVHGFIRGLIGSEATGAPAAVARVGMLLRAAAGAVFVIACANVAGFLLARASARSKDTATRVALGADRRQLAMELLADGVFVSLAGGTLGLLLAFWTVAVIPALFFAPDADQLVFAPSSGGVVAIAAACAAITIACSLVPLVEVRHDNPAIVLQRESLGTSRTSRRLRSLLVIVQMTCCCVLVISTGLLLRGFRAALETGIGQRLGNPLLVTVQARARAGRQETATHGLQYFDEVEQTARAAFNVRSAAWVAQPPGSRPALQSLQIEPPDLPLRDVVADVAVFDTRSLADVMLPPIAGRMFGGGDTPDRCPVVIVNEAAARELFGGDAVGQFLEDPAGARTQIIGVVATRPTDAAVASRPTVYYYAAQTRPPADRLGAMPFRVSARPESTRATLATNIVSARYFETVGLQTVAGDPFSTPLAAHGCRVGVVVAGDDDATTLAIVGTVLWFDEHNIKRAFELFDRALALSNSNVLALSNSALALAWMEKTEAAIERAHRALQVSPYDTLFAFIALTAAHFHAKRYAEAVDAATRAVESNPDFSISYAYLAAALFRAGRLEEARVTARLVLALDPTMSIRRWSAELGFMQAVFEPFAEALHIAGIPEG